MEQSDKGEGSVAHVTKFNQYAATMSSEEQQLFSAASISDLTGLDETELQAFLEQRDHESAHEEAQGSLISAAVTASVHC